MPSHRHLWLPACTVLIALLFPSFRSSSLPTPRILPHPFDGISPPSGPHLSASARRHLSQDATPIDAHVSPPGDYVVFDSLQEVRDLAMLPSSTTLLRASPSSQALPFGSEPFTTAPDTMCVVDAGNRAIDATQMQEPVSEVPLNSTILFYNSHMYMPDLLWPWALTTMFYNSILIFNDESFDPIVKAWMAALEQVGDQQSSYFKNIALQLPDSPERVTFINTTLLSLTPEMIQARLVALSPDCSSILPSPGLRSGVEDGREEQGGHMLGLPVWSVMASLIGVSLICALVAAIAAKHCKNRRMRTSELSNGAQDTHTTDNRTSFVGALHYTHWSSA